MNRFRKVVIECADTTPREIQLELIPIEKSKRIFKATKALFILWTCMGFAVFIPMVHFVLVPGLFLAGIFFAISGYIDDVQLAPTKLKCSKCAGDAQPAHWSDQFPKWMKCAGCGAEMKIELQR
jgi:hypothetical protein